MFPSVTTVVILAISLLSALSLVMRTSARRLRKLGQKHGNLKRVVEAVETVVAVEVGLLTPPFGLSVYVIKSTLGNSVDISLGDIFRGTAPFTLTMLAVLVLLVGLAAIQLGVPLEPLALTVMVLVSALPSACNVSLLAERLGADNGRIARIILVTTALAFFSFSAAVTLLL